MVRGHAFDSIWVAKSILSDERCSTENSSRGICCYVTVSAMNCENVTLYTCGKHTCHIKLSGTENCEKTSRKWMDFDFLHH